MVRGHLLLKRELVKQSALIDLPFTHHHLHSRFDDWSESAKQHHCNLSVFQQNRTIAAAVLLVLAGLIIPRLNASAPGARTQNSLPCDGMSGVRRIPGAQQPSSQAQTVRRGGHRD
jgi:hypothetical protein